MADIVDPTKRPVTRVPMLDEHGSDAQSAPASRVVAQDQRVTFHDDRDGLTGAIADFLGRGVRAKDVLTVIATKSSSDAVRARLEADGIDAGRLLATGQLTVLDAHKTLSTFMREGQPDPALFAAHVGGRLANQTSSQHPRLRAYGEMMDVLWSEGHRGAALRLEELWNDLQAQHPFTLVCAYSMASFYKEPSALQHAAQSEEHGAREARTTDLPPPYARELEKRAEIEQALRSELRELRRREEALRVRERQLEAITDALPVLVSHIDAEGRYRFVNAAYERWFGYSKSDVLGKRVEDVAGPDAYTHMRPHFERVLAGHATSYEADLRFRDGKPRSVHAAYVPQFSGDKPAGFVALVTDVTERKSFERYRQAAAERSERLLRITSAIADAVSPEEVINAVVDEVAAAVDASSAGLWLVDEQNTTATLVRGIGYSDAAMKAFAAVPIDRDPPIPAIDSIRGGEPIWITSQRELLERYPHLAKAVTPGRAYGVICLPLVSRGRTLGSLGLTIPESTGWSDDEKRFLVLVARYASQSIERLRLLETERRSRAAADDAAARTNVLNHTSRVFMDADMDLQTRLAEIVRELGSVISGAAGITLLQPDGLFRTAAVFHPSPEAQTWLQSLAETAPLHVGEGVSGVVTRTGESVLVPATDPADIAARAAPAYREYLERHPTYAMMVAPLRVRGSRIIGTVTASRTQPGETYTAADLSLLEALAERAASAIENARLHRENVEARIRAEQLYRFAQAVVSADKVEQVFDAGLDSIAQALGASRSAILLFDDDGVMRFRAWRALSEGYRRTVEGHSPWSRDTVDPQPVLVPDVHADAALAAYGPLFRDERIAALAFIPLVTRGRLIGKFMIYYDRAHAFSSAEVDTALAIANHLASVTARFAAVAELERTLHYNELFAGVLAHDLRNPLGAMITAAQLLLMRQEGEGDRTTKPLSRILSSGQRMSRMIEQLLDLTRARSGGGIAVQPRETNLADLCSSAISELELLFPERTIQYDVAGDQSGCWDEDRLTQIISNLVANAAQHAVPGRPITIELDGKGATEVMLRVHNEGAIAANLLPHLFDPFRGTRHRREHSQGLGLGLFIVKELVRAHGGTVDVVSSDAAGTTFTIRMPRAHPRALAAE